MARDAVTITEVAAGTPVDRGAGTSINTSNGASIDCGGDTSDLLIIVTNTNTTPDHDLTVQAGDTNPPAIQNGVGDLVFNVNAAESWLVVDGARHVNADGKIYLDFESGFAGKVHAVRLVGV